MHYQYVLRLRKITNIVFVYLFYSHCTPFIQDSIVTKVS